MRRGLITFAAGLILGVGATRLPLPSIPSLSNQALSRRIAQLEIDLIEYRKAAQVTAPVPVPVPAHVPPAPEPGRRSVSIPDRSEP